MMTTRQMMNALMAFDEGYAIECTIKGKENWRSDPIPGWNFYNYDYRVMKNEEGREVKVSELSQLDYIDGEPRYLNETKSSKSKISEDEEFEYEEEEVDEDEYEEFEDEDDSSNSLNYTNPSVKYPNVSVRLIGEDGNAFSIMGRVAQAMRRAKISEAEIEQYITDAKSGTYDDLLVTTIRYVVVE